MSDRYIFLVFLLLLATPLTRGDLLNEQFPASFVFGVSSAAVPTEGAWDAEGKSASIWDTFTEIPGRIEGAGDTKTSADGYGKIKEDLQLLKRLGVSHYKFSLSWPRLLPEGTTNRINEAGFLHYNSLIDELLTNQITPFVTLHYWDLPQALQNLGGWANSSSVAWFKEYANITFSRFGDRVKLWTTIDDPYTLTYKGYETAQHAPGLRRPDLFYGVAHNVLLAHTEAYHLYKDSYKVSQKGEVGISLDSDWFEPKTNSSSDLLAAERALTFRLGWFTEPLFNGDYPNLMKERIILKRSQQGVNQKLPEFTSEQQLRIKGALDFLGISHFATKLVSDKVSTDPNPGYYTDQDLVLEPDMLYPKLEYRPEINPGSGKRLTGFGLRKLVNYVTEAYTSPAIYVTQNGLETCGSLQDQNRIDVISEYSHNALQAIKDGADVRGYFVWSLVDGFDWELGYTSKTGLYYVDFSQDGRPRFPRSSAAFYKALIANRGLNDTIVNYRAYPADRDDFYYGQFPDDFKWGAASAAYQIEGGWNVDGKGPSIWDTFAHNGRINHGLETGDITCDSYHLYLQDIRILKELKVQFYRFSLSWSRILPDGTRKSLNQKGVDYYNKVIDALLANNIEPMVTLFHWDLPQALQDIGGWENDSVIDIFVDYARLCFQIFGNRVKTWITFNEPKVSTYLGYGIAFFPPSLADTSVLVYTVGHNIIKAHARTYHMYRNEFKAKYNGTVGITFDTTWREPLTDSPENAEAAERSQQFSVGWFANPIFGDTGDYPDIMKEIIDRKSPGLAKSRLPEFTDAEKQLNKGSSDFLGLNHYTSSLVSNRPTPDTIGNYDQDQEIEERRDFCWTRTTSEWLYFNPWGIRYQMRWAKETYKNPIIYITENGRPDEEDLTDDGRIYYYKYYINEVLKAIRLDGVDIRAFTAWSLMDNLEWADGTVYRFGLYQVNFTDPHRTRTARASAQFYRELIQKNGFH